MSSRLRTMVFATSIIFVFAMMFGVRHSNNWVVSLESGMQALAAGKPDEAARNFTVVLVKHPNDTPANLAMAEICVKNSDYVSAESFLKRVVAAVPENNHAEFLLGVVYLKTGRFNDVLDVTETLALHHAAGPEVQELFAAALEGKGNYALAGDRYRKMHRYDDAVADFLKALRQNPADEFSKRGLAETYRAKGMTTEADALEKEPNATTQNEQRGKPKRTPTPL